MAVQHQVFIPRGNGVLRVQKHRARQVAFPRKATEHIVVIVPLDHREVNFREHGILQPAHQIIVAAHQGQEAVTGRQSVRRQRGRGHLGGWGIFCQGRQFLLVGSFRLRRLCGRGVQLTQTFLLGFELVGLVDVVD